MPKVPNYTSVHDYPYEKVVYKWLHDDNSNKSVEVLEKDDTYSIILMYGSYINEKSSFSNKSNAREQAVEWMCNNPDGWEPENHYIDYS